MDRYGAGARWYDALSLERLLYRPGRRDGIAALHLRAGQRVLDVGCGTGLSLAALRAGVTPGGEVVGQDPAPAMLARAGAKVQARGWVDVRLVTGGPDGSGAPFDAALCCYVLSVADRWRETWAATLAAVRPGGRVAVVDLAPPRGRGRWLVPLAWLAVQAGGADWHRAPWQLAERDLDDVCVSRRRGGHVVMVAGTVR